ncbi:MAG: recombination mediator RecR [Chloroflexi bacterium]|nr:recombination mediator RecR [Chloroflexota bacterium]
MTSPEYLPPVEPIARLIQEFHRLPGIGPRTAQKLAYHLIRAPKADAEGLADALRHMVENVRFCATCQNVTQADPCALCADPERDATVLCVVEEPLDVLALERSGAFSGRYHVLHGVLSPMDGVGPDRLRIRDLLDRLRQPAVAALVKEVVIATNPSLEGEATAMYIRGLLTPLGLRVTRLARGLPSGSDLEFADSVTLARAMDGRQEF